MRVFNGKGCEHEVLLLLKLFNKYNGADGTTYLIDLIKFCGNVNGCLQKSTLLIFSKNGFFDGIIVPVIVRKELVIRLISSLGSSIDVGNVEEIDINWLF